MFFIDLIHYLKGYLKVEFSGDMSERMLNICAANRITLWDIGKQNGKLCAHISISDFRKLRVCRGRSRVIPHILLRRGLPFTVKKYKWRIGHCVGALIFCLIISFLGSRVWDIRVLGSGSVSETAVIDACKELGIYEGVSISKVDTNNSSLRLPLIVDGIAWCAFNIEGTTLNIEIEEITDREEAQDNVPCNLISLYDGIITELHITHGYSRVKVGDSVAKGDILVDGAVELKNESILYSHSSGKVYARVRRSISHSVPLRSRIFLPDGKKKSKSVVSLFSLKIPIYLGSFSGDKFTNLQSRELTIDNVHLPIYIHTAEFIFLNKLEVLASEEEAVFDCRGKLYKTIMSGDVKNFNIVSEKIVNQDGVVSIKWVIESEENIASQEKLDVFY